MSEQKTEWFNALKTYPDKPGVYEVRLNDGDGWGFSKWDGNRWCFVSKAFFVAEKEKMESFVMNVKEHKPQWRGFKNKQEYKKAKN